MERSKYIKYVNELYKDLILYENIIPILNKKKHLYKNAPIEGNNLYKENHKNGLKLEIEILQDKKYNIVKKFKTIEYKLRNTLHEIYRSKYKECDLSNKNDSIYNEYNTIRNKVDKSEIESIDTVVVNNSIKKDTKLYNETILYCIKKIVERKDVEDINPVYYPDYNNPNFSSCISKRSEFMINIPKRDKSCNNTEFELSSYQIFLKNFISDNTPYNSIFIYHGTGTGKTCSAVSIAENYRDIYKNKDKRIIVLSSRNIASGWYNNIYNPAKGTNQCTGEEYVKMAETKENFDISSRNRLVNNFYEFSGYKKFANDIKKILNSSRDGFAEIKKTYSNRLLIIDEVHNIRSESESKTKNILKYIEYAIRYSDNLKLIILSATPMYNKATEIVWILNMMLLNDNKEPLNESDIFRMGRLRSSGKRLLEKAMRGRVSYIRGETPDKFPIRLYPIDSKEYSIKKITGDPFNTGDYKFRFLKLYGSKMKSHQLSVYNEELDEVIKNKVGDNPKMTEDIRISQISNMTYPVDSNDIREKYGKTGIEQIFNITSDGVYSYKDKRRPILDIDYIENYSAKIHNILKLIDNSEGIIYIYSFWVEGTIIPLILALEHYGYIHYTGKSFLKYDKKRKTTKNNKFAVITANPILSKNNTEDIKILTDESNKNGDNIKIVIGSLVSSEGIDMKYIREIHVVDPWHHLNRLEQIIGRGIRYCSHEGLEDENGYSKKNVMIYLHVVMLDNGIETVDELMYRSAEEKSVDIGEIEMLLKENAIDCELFKSINVITKNDVKPINMITSQGDKIEKYRPYDRPYSKACSFTKKCNYICNTKKTLKLKSNNMNTFNDKVGRNIYKIIHKYIKSLYKIKNIYTIKEIIDYINEYIDMNEKIIYLALQDMIQRKITIHSNNIQGYIIYNNNYYIFQPSNSRDETLNIYERQDIKLPQRKHINLTIKKKQKNIAKKEKVETIAVEIKKVKEKIKSQVDFILNIKKEIDKKNLDETNYNWITDSKSVLNYQYSIDRLDLNEKLELLKDVITKNTHDDFDKIVIDYYKRNFIYKIDGKYKIDEELDKRPLGFVLFNKVSPIVFIVNNDNVEQSSSVLEQIIEFIKEYKDTKKYKSRYTHYGDIWAFNDSGKLKIITSKSINPIKTTYRGKEYIKYGMDCVPTQSNNQSYDDSVKLIDLIKDDSLDGIKGDLVEKKFSRKYMCVLFELICRKYTSDNLIYHLKEDSIFMKKEIINLI